MHSKRWSKSAFFSNSVLDQYFCFNQHLSKSSKYAHLSWFLHQNHAKNMKSYLKPLNIHPKRHPKPWKDAQITRNAHTPLTYPCTLDQQVCPTCLRATAILKMTNTFSDKTTINWQFKQNLCLGESQFTFAHNKLFSARFQFLGATQLREEFQTALVKGLPFPILTAAEYLSLDGEGFCWGRSYRSAGYYASIFLWSVFLRACLLKRNCCKVSSSSPSIGTTLEGPIFSRIIWVWARPIILVL